MSVIFNDEINRRREFQAVFEGHFLNRLFVGLDDMPPPFATESPSQFDASLPNLSVSGKYQYCTEVENEIIEFPYFCGLFHFISIVQIPSYD